LKIKKQDGITMRCWTAAKHLPRLSLVGIGVEPKDGAKILWNKFSLFGTDYSAGDPGWRKFADGCKTGVKSYFDRARRVYKNCACYADESC
jgi:hypothetical protein